MTFHPSRSMLTRADHAAEVARLTAPILDRIQQALDEKNLSWQGLARTSGISRETISQTIASRAAPPSLVTLVAICRSLGLRVGMETVHEDRADEIPPPPQPAPVPSMDPSLVVTPHQQCKRGLTARTMLPASGTQVTSSAWLTTSELARLAGIVPGQLLVWSDRYGWPPTLRDQHGNRRFDIAIVDDLREVVRLRDRGRPIRKILGGGVPELATAAPKRTIRHLPEVTLTTTEGRAIHRIIEGAFSFGQDRSGITAMMQTALPRVPEPDRTTLQKLLDGFPGEDVGEADASDRSSP